HGNPGVGAIFAQDVVMHADVPDPIHVAVVVANDALQSVHTGFLGGHAVTHVLHDGVRAGNLDVLFAAAGSSGGAHVLVAIATGADDGRIATASGQLPGQAAGCGHARHLSLLVQGGAVNGPVRRIKHAVDGV